MRVALVANLLIHLSSGVLRKVHLCQVNRAKVTTSTLLLFPVEKSSIGLIGVMLKEVRKAVLSNQVRYIFAFWVSIYCSI